MAARRWHAAPPSLRGAHFASFVARSSPHPPKPSRLRPGCASLLLSLPLAVLLLARARPQIASPRNRCASAAVILAADSATLSRTAPTVCPHCYNDGAWGATLRRYCLGEPSYAYRALSNPFFVPRSPRGRCRVAVFPPTEASLYIRRFLRARALTHRADILL